MQDTGTKRRQPRSPPESFHGAFNPHHRPGRGWGGSRGGAYSACHPVEEPELREETSLVKATQQGLNPGAQLRSPHPAMAGMVFSSGPCRAQSISFNVN